MEHAHHPIHTPIVTVSSSEEHQPLLHQMTVQSALSSTHGHPLPPPSHGLQAPSGTLPSPQQSKRVVLNVGGVRHEVMWKTLDRLPHTRLGKLSQCTTHEALMELCDDYNTEEFFFDRQPRSFSSILNFYQTGRLHLAEDVCVLSLGEDLQYWNIDEQYLDLCCQNKYHHRKDRVLEELRKDAKIAVEDFGSGCCAKWRQKLWDLLEKPHTSTVALVLTIVSIVTIIAYVIILMVETFPHYKTFVIKAIDGNDSNLFIYEDENIDQTQLIIDVVFIAFFTIEFVLRFWATPSKLAFFFKGPLNIIDLLANVAGYISLFLYLSTKGAIQSMGLLTVLQIFRIFRIVKLTRYSTVVVSLGYTLKRSWKELVLLVMFLAIAIVVFSSLVYFAEGDSEQSPFASIPNALWWAVVTMTTVGYGDMLPSSVWGRLVGAACCICGILFIVLPIPILVNNFRECYSEQIRHMEVVKRREVHDRAKRTGDIASHSAVNAQDANGGGGVGGGGVGGGGVGAGRVGGGGGKDPDAVLIASYPFIQATDQTLQQDQLHLIQSIKAVNSN